MYSGGDFAQEGVVSFDFRNSTIDSAPGFMIRMPRTGDRKAFQLLNGNDEIAWASFEYGAGGTNRPGLALGSGLLTRDTNIYRDAANILRTDDTLVVGDSFRQISSATSSYFLGNLGIGTTSPVSRLALQNTGFSEAGNAGITQFLSFTNNAASAVYYGDNAYLVNTPTATSTLVGKIVRIEDSTTLGNTVRGIEVQTQRGTNTLGENTALSGFARTFGVSGTTRGDAGALFEPAGVYGETSGTTQGNALRGYSSTITTAALLKLFQASSSFAGTGLLMNFGNTTGLFNASTSKFVDLQNAGTSRFTISAFGTTTIGDGTTNHQAGLQIGFGGLCVDNDGACAASTTGRITSVSSATGNSDLAEMYFSSQPLKAGEVVYAQGELSIGWATGADAERIIGVVSTKPGLTLGFDDTSLTSGEKPFSVALSGRVPIRLSNENGAIRVGDELMISSLPGVAMKASSTGTVIGIALEDFDERFAYSDTYVNQFGDDIIEPIFVPINPIDDPRINDGCYYGGGNATGEEECVPLVATKADDRVAEASERAAKAARTQALATLAQTKSERKVTPAGQSVLVGQIVMFVDLRERYLDAASEAMIATLLSTPVAESFADAFNQSNENTVWSRLRTLANQFVDGVLSVFTLRADRVEVKDELCVDGVCIGADDLRQILKQNQSGQVNNAPENDVSDDANSQDTAGSELITDSSLSVESSTTADNPDTTNALDLGDTPSSESLGDTPTEIIESSEAQEFGSDYLQ